MIWFGLGIGVLVLGGLLAVAAGGYRAWSSAFGGITALAGSALALTSAVQVLVHGQELSFSWAWEVPLGRLVLGIDALSALFILPIGVVVAAAAVYGTQYLSGPHGPARTGGMWLGFNL